MSKLTENFASWEEECLLAEPHFLGQDSIATETQQKESPEWEVCLDALLRIWSDSSTLEAPQPTKSAIEAAIGWVAFLKRRYPSDPPTCIIPEPDGGLIVERRATGPDGHEWVCELTFYNDERAERADYCDGRILRLTSIPRQPQGSNA